MKPEPLYFDLDRLFCDPQLKTIENIQFYQIRFVVRKGSHGQSCLRKGFESDFRMYRRETLLLGGDSIWGRVTWLLGSLTGRPCTAKQRVLFYEHMLIESMDKRTQVFLGNGEKPFRNLFFFHTAAILHLYRIGKAFLRLLGKRSNQRDFWQSYSNSLPKWYRSLVVISLVDEEYKKSIIIFDCRCNPAITSFFNREHVREK